MPPKRSNGDLAYAMLRQRIRDREFQPGDVLSENALARDFGMSRTPVREAVSRLVQDGLLVVLPKRGIMVATLAVRDIEETYSIREVLEGLAARLAAIRATAHDTAQIADTLERLGVAVSSRDADQFFRLDHEFHRLIAESARNRRLAALLANMRDADLLDYFAGGDNRRAERLDISMREHCSVFEAICQRDAVEAERRMRDHCLSAARFIADYAFGVGAR